MGNIHRPVTSETSKVYQQIMSEELVSLDQAVRLIPRPKGKRKISYQTIWRWTKHGVNGRLLPTIRIGQQLFTSKERLANYLSEMNRPAAK